MPASGRRVFWTAWASTVVAMLIEHIVWFLVRSQSLVQAFGYLYVPLLMGLVAGLLSGALAVAAQRLTRGKPAIIRHVAVTVLAVLGATIGTLPFPAMFLYKWFTIPVIVVVVGVAMVLLTRDRVDAHPDSGAQ